MKLTQKIAREQLKSVGMTLARTEYGDYRVSPRVDAFPSLTREGREDVASYHADIEDAVNSGVATANSLRERLDVPTLPIPAPPMDPRIGQLNNGKYYAFQRFTDDVPFVGTLGQVQRAITEWDHELKLTVR